MSKDVFIKEILTSLVSTENIAIDFYNDKNYLIQANNSKMFY